MACVSHTSVYGVCQPKLKLNAEHKLSALPCGVCWHPSENTAAVIDVDGQYAIWSGVVPSHLPGPTAPVDDQDMLTFSIEGEDEEEHLGFGGDDDKGGEDDDEDALADDDEPTTRCDQKKFAEPTT
eukprot:2194898-Pyramimonas_sp.AAC.1